MNRAMQNILDRKIQQTYNEAVFDLRKRVEQKGEDVEDALREITARYPLGLNQLAEITRTAKERYEK